MEAGLDQVGETRLTGWKRVADYLGCSERTARRWEKEENLPVHRQLHESRGLVFAIPSELDVWIASRTEYAETPDKARFFGKIAPRSMAVIASTLMLCVIAVCVVLIFASGWSGVDKARAKSSSDPIAVDLYDRGRALWKQRGEAQNTQAISLLTAAVERDETFAVAWAALASAWLTYPTYSENVEVAYAIDEALLAADRAITLDPTLAEPRSVMAKIAQRRSDWLNSERIYKTALQADQDNSTLLLWFASHYQSLGLIEEAQKLIEAAHKLDPNSPPILIEIAMNQYHTGLTQESIQGLDHLWFDLGQKTSSVWAVRFLALIEQDNFESAISWVQETPYKKHSSLFVEFVKQEQHQNVSAGRTFIEQVKSAHQNGLPAWLAYHMLDERDMYEAALDVLEAESQDGLFDNSVVLFFPRGGRTWQTEGFAELVDRLGYVEYWRNRKAPDICKARSDAPLCLNANKKAPKARAQL